ncbi:PASTA domain-containing protein [Streptosporangium sp. DT93]|uniref:PASTA domain-containing protein n=1 Tax=Streptosporangium sp. DT93 TaxID=3393428 RepID=UPI003CF25BEC
MLTGTRVNRVILVVSVVALVTAMGVGSGYRISQAAFLDSGMYLPKGKGVVRVDLDNRAVDAQTARNLATGKETLEVVQVSPDSVFVVNNDTGVVSHLPTDTLMAESVEERPKSKGELDLMAGGGQAYLLDGTAGTLSKLDGKGTKPGPVPTPNPVTEAVVDSKGVVWAYSAATGELMEIIDVKVKNTWKVADPGEAVELTSVADAPVVYRPQTGQAGLYGPEGLRGQLELGARHGIPSSPGPGTTVAVAVRSDGTLVTGDFNSGDIGSIELPDRAGHVFGPPVVNHSRVYVPDYTERHVVIVDLAGGKVTHEPVPGPDEDFQIVARDDRVWVNNQHDRMIIAFDANGRKTQFDSGVDDKPLITPTPTPTPTAPTIEPPPTVQPTVQPTARPRVLRPSARPEPVLDTVPDVVGLDRRAACAKLMPKLRCVEVSQPEGSGETDVVQSSVPAARERVKRGTAVKVFYRGPTMVPSVLGVSADEACQALAEAKLTCRKLAQGLAKTSTEVGKVTTQTPQAGTPATTGTEVNVVYPSLIEVGSYLNQPIEAACAAVQQAGFNCEQREVGQGATVGVVRAQNPSPATGLAAGRTVTIDFLGNPAVPNLVGLTPDAACAALQGAHLKCNPVDDAVTLDVNKVLTQNHPVGTRLAPGETVTYVFETTAPVPLNRTKAPAPGRANHLSLAGGPAGWSQQSSLGRVYPPTGGISGLQVIHQFRCGRPELCDEPGSYYFSPGAGEHAGFILEGPAFSCFTTQVPGTVPLWATMKSGGTWVWAVHGSQEWNHFASTGFGSRFDFAVCYIWPPG